MLFKNRYIFIIAVFLISCIRKPNDYNYVIEKLDEHFDENKEFPMTLSQISIQEELLCYSFDENGYDLNLFREMIYTGIIVEMLFGIFQKTILKILSVPNKFSDVINNE